LNDENVFGEAGYIISQKPNVSHDLRLLYMLEIKVKGSYIKSLLNMVKYNVKVKPPMISYGTKENKVSGLPKNTINNVHDASSAILLMMEQLERLGFNDGKYPDDDTKKLGDLHVYADGTPLRWVPL